MLFESHLTSVFDNIFKYKKHKTNIYKSGCCLATSTGQSFFFKTAAGPDGTSAHTSPDRARLPPVLEGTGSASLN